MRTKRSILIAVAAAIVLAAVGVTLLLVGRTNAAHAEYLAVLKSSPGARFEGLPDSQLLVGFDSRCDTVRILGTVQGATTAANRNWEGVKGIGDGTKGQFIANSVATFLAAQATC